MKLAWIAALAGCGALPAIPELAHPPAHTCTAAACDATPVPTDAKAPAALWRVRFDGGTMKLPADDGVDWYGLVVRGTLTVEGCGLLEPWTAFRIPQGGATLSGKGDAVLGAAADKPLAALGALGPAKGGGAAGKCEHVDVGSVSEVTWAHGTAHARLVFRGGRAYFGVLYSAAGAGSPPHTHGGSWELVHVLGGGGETLGADEIGPIVPGQSMAFAPGQPHGFKNQGEPLVAVQMYAPPGPEQRFLDLAAGKPAAPK